MKPRPNVIIRHIPAEEADAGYGCTYYYADGAVCGRDAEHFIEVESQDEFYWDGTATCESVLHTSTEADRVAEKVDAGWHSEDRSERYGSAG